MDSHSFTPRLEVPTIDGFHLQIDCQKDPALLSSLSRLSQEVFALDLAAWMAAGCWKDGTHAHTLFYGSRAAANVLASPMRLEYRGSSFPAVQLGGVAAAPEFRGRGLARRLMEQVLQSYPDAFFFLYANDSVLDFYPRFGFVSRPEYTHTAPVIPHTGRLRRMDPIRDQALLEKLYWYGNSWSSLRVSENPDIFLFNCHHEWREDLWYWEDVDVMGVIRWKGAEMYCAELLGRGAAALRDTLSAFARRETRRAVLAFPPLSPESEPVLWTEPDTTLFIRPTRSMPIGEDKLIFTPMLRT